MVSRNIFQDKTKIEEESNFLSETITQQGMSQVEFETENSLMVEYQEIISREECYWKSKSWEVQLREGGINIKFFYNSKLKAQGNINFKITRVDSFSTFYLGKINPIDVFHFQKLLGGDMNVESLHNSFLEAITNEISMEEN